MGENKRGIESQEPGGKVPKLRRTRVMLIGIDKYAHWPQLGYPVRDCLGFFEVLRKHYGFTEADLVPADRKQLLDEEATADSIFDELYRLADKDEYGNPHLGPKDNLIVYFSGHGHFDKTLDEGYWAPVDAPLPNRASDLRKLISVGEVVKALSSMDAHHIVLIVDACFPQAFTRMNIEVIAGGDPNNPEEKPSRWALTSGRLETVPDKSLFAESLRDLLENNDNPKLSVTILGGDVMKRVWDKGLQNAWSASLTENRFDGGAFFFYRQTPAPVIERIPRPVIEINTLPQRMREGSQKYLERLKSGRFRHLRIESLLLTETKLPKLVSIEVKVLEEQTPLQNAVSSLWGKERPHAVVLGKGGMGKTVSLLHLWEDQLNSGASTIPVFVALNEYNALPENEQHDFVLRSIARNCGLAEVLTDDWRNAIWDILRQPQSDDTPSLLLLLDGFNEVTAERKPLLAELNRIARDARGVQMAITSRYVEIRNFQWAQESEIVELQPLPEVVVSDYLQTLGIDPPTDHALWQLLGNPMMLTIFAGSSQIAHAYSTDPRFRFLPARSVGELLWNFTEALLVKSYEDHAHDPGEQAWHRFLIRCLLPYIAYRMEANGDFFLSDGRRDNPQFNYKSLLEEAFVVLDHPDLTEVFPEFEGRRGQLGLGEAPNLDAAERRARRVREYLLEKLHLMVLEKESLRFLHQNFRDFFAACHILNDASRSLSVNQLPDTFKERVLPDYVSKLVGELEGEHHNKMALNEKSWSWSAGQFALDNRLSSILNRCRGIFDRLSLGYTVINVLTIYKDARQELTGADLSRLDLQGVNFHDVMLNRHFGKKYFAPDFTGALIRGSDFFSPLTQSIKDVAYDPTGTKMAVATGNDIQLWDLETRSLIKVLEGHTDTVNSVRYNKSGQKVLSASADGTIREWWVDDNFVSALFGELPKDDRSFDLTYNSGNSVIRAIYAPNEDKILGVESKRLVEWKVGSYNQYIELTDWISKEKVFSDAIYAFDSDEKIYSCYINPEGLFSSQGIHEWSVSPPQKTLQLQSKIEYQKLCFFSTKNGKRIIVGMGFHSIELWDLDDHAIINTIAPFVGDTFGWLKNAVLSPCSNWILLVGPDFLEKRDTNNLELIMKIGERPSRDSMSELASNKMLSKGDRYWHKNIINGATISPDSKRILTYENLCIKEWDSVTGELLKTFKWYDNWIAEAVYSPVGQKIITSSKDETIKEWSSSTGICIQVIRKEILNTQSIDYHPNGYEIIASSEENGYYQLEKYDLISGIISEKYTSKYGIGKILYNPSGKKILFSYAPGFLSELTEGKIEMITREFSDVYAIENLKNALYSIDGKWVIAITDDNSIHIWSAITHKLYLSFKMSKISESIFHAVEKFYGIKDDLEVKMKLLQLNLYRTYSFFKNWKKDEYSQLEKVDFVSLSPDCRQIILCSREKCKIVILEVDLPEKHEDIKTTDYQFLSDVPLDQWPLKQVNNPIYCYKPDYAIISKRQNMILLKRSSEGGGKDIVELRDLKSPDNILANFKCGVNFKPVFSPNDLRIAYTPENNILREVSTVDFEVVMDYPDYPGLFVQSCDFSNLHPESKFTPQEMDLLRRYGVIFNELDEADWVWAIETAYPS